MNTIVVDEMTVDIPEWVRDFKSFRRWAHSQEFPETGRICYFHGKVWVDMSREQFFSHNQAKNEYGYVITGLVKAGKRGRYIPDGMLLSNEQAQLTSRPDGAFVSLESFQTGRVRLVEAVLEGHIELEGSPDMVLEVVSKSSVKKDTIILPELYWKAGIEEYWLVDVRGERLRFDIFRHTPNGYQATRKQGGWVKSSVFGKSFRLLRQFDDEGNPEYTLEVR